MRNVLYISHVSELGGAENSLLLLVGGIDRTRFNPTAVVPGPGPLTDRLDEIGVPHRVVPMRRMRRTLNPFALGRYFVRWRRAVARITRLIGELDVDLVHANSTTAHLFGWPAARRGRVPCIWHVRDVSSPGGWFDTLMTRNATAVIAISNAALRRMHHPALANPKACVIYNGVDTGRFAPGDRMTLRRELGLADSTPLAGIVGQVVPWKGHERFLEAAAKAAPLLRDARFLVVGDNRFGDYPGMLDRLKAKAREFGLGHAVMFLGWRDDAVAVMNALDLLVVTSETEAFGRVVVEAMACEKPVVSFRCGGPEEIIEHGKTGLLIERSDTGAMADAIVQLLRDRARAAAMGKLGRRVACERFSAAAHVAKVQEVYDRLLG